MSDKKFEFKSGWAESIGCLGILIILAATIIIMHFGHAWWPAK